MILQRSRKAASLMDSRITVGTSRTAAPKATRIRLRVFSVIGTPSPSLYSFDNHDPSFAHAAVGGIACVLRRARRARWRAAAVHLRMALRRGGAEDARREHARRAGHAGHGALGSLEEAAGARP